MSYEDVKKVWMNGRLVDFADAKIHAFAHVFHYGSAMFEGARVYKTKQRLGGLPPRRAHQAPLRLLQGLPDGDPATRRRSSRTRSSRRSAPTASTSATSGRSSTAASALSASTRSTARSTS